MKRITGIIMSAMIAAGALSGCSSSTVTSPAATAASAEVQTGTTGSASTVQDSSVNQNGTGAQSSTATQPGAGQSGDGKQKMETADLTGEIQSVDGNSFTLKLIEMPSMGNGGPQGNPPSGDGNAPDGAAPSGSAPAGVPDAASTGSASTGAAPSGTASTDTAPSGTAPSGNGAPPSDSNGKGGPAMTTTYTGETKTVSIPDTAAITSRGGGKDAQATTLAVADLKAGDVVQIWFADDGTTVSKVSVMNMPTAATKAN